MPKLIRILPGGRRLLLLAVPALLGVGTLTAAYIYTSGGASPMAQEAPVIAGLSAPAPAGLLVDVIGAVNHPGLYRMNRGDRVPDMAGRLKDGEQVKVPFAKTTGATVVTRISLNTGTLEELETIPGFSTAFAAAVIDYRTNFGGFENIRELVEVLGMSEADFVIAKRYVAM